MAEINAVKKKAYSVLKQYKHRDLSLEDLVHLADENGFTVLDYSKTSEESDTETIIKELGLSSFAKTGNSFVYKRWFFEEPAELLQYCIVLLVFLLMALWAFNKLRKEIADVL